MKKKIISGVAAGAVIIGALVFAFVHDGNAPVNDTIGTPISTQAPQDTAAVQTPDATVSIEPSATAAPTPTQTPQAETTAVSTVTEPVQAPVAVQTAAADNEVKQEPITPTQKPEVTQAPAPQQKTECSISIRCDTVFNNMKKLKAGKEKIIPSDGVVLKSQTVSFEEGDSVFDVVLRETKKNKIHLEFEKTPSTNSVYVEGIANLYEFDCGDLSGWMYKVNGDIPNVGMSEYKLKKNDKIEIVYTCDMGVDVGGMQY